MKNAFMWCIGLVVLQSLPIWAAASVEQFVTTVNTTFRQVSDVIVNGAFISGMMFAIMGIVKLKGHKDAPAQIPLSTPFVLIAASAGLLFLPTFFELIGSALFSNTAVPGLTLPRTLNF